MHRTCSRKFSALSGPTRTLWAKSGEMTGHGLLAHLLDVAAVVETLLALEPPASMRWAAQAFGLPQAAVSRWAAALAAMPSGARVLNISRGEVIDEPALIDALASRHLGGAYLDVFTTEPLPAASPLWDMPGVLVTAHDASTSDAYDPRINALFLDNLARWRRNEPLLNEVTQL